MKASIFVLIDALGWEWIKDHPFLKVGQRIRVRGGSLNGVTGILVAVNGLRNLVISVEPIQRSLCISLDGYDVEMV